MKHKFIRMSQHWSLCKLWGGENDFFNLSVTQALLPNDNLRTSSGIRSFLGLKKKSMPYWIKSLYMCNHLLWSIDNFQSKAPSCIHCIYKQYLSHTNSLLFFEESKMDHQSFFYHVDWDVIVLGVCKWVYNIQIMRGESSTDWETDWRAERRTI